MKKTVPFIILILIIFLVHYYLPETDSLFEDIRKKLLDLGWKGPLALIGLYILSSIVLFPATLFTLLGGALYGPWLAAIYVTIGANIGALIAFLLSRYFAFGFAERVLEKYFPTVEKEIEKNGFLWVFTLRLFPLTPFVFFNYAAGITKLRRRDYMLGTFLGMLPMTFIYASLGSVLIDWKNPENWWPFGIAIALAVIVFVIKKRKNAS